jgi:trigger factor
LSSEITSISGCKRKLAVTVPTKEVEEVIDRLAVSYAARARVPGFRPGKVPMSVLRSRFAAELREEATQEIINHSWKQVMAEQGLHPLAEPQLEDVQGGAGNDLRFSLSFEVLPEIGTIDYKEAQVQGRPAQIEDREVEEALEKLREEHGQYVPIEDTTISDGHLVTVMLDSEVQGGAGRHMHEENVNIIVGDPHTREEFTSNLRGAAVGDTREFEVQFAPEHRNKRLAGQTVRYHLEVQDIKEKSLPELNDDFARDRGTETLEDLRLKLRNDLVRNAERIAEEKAKGEVIDQIVQAHPFDLPDTLVSTELEERAHQLAAKLAFQGIDVNKTSINWKKVFEEDRPEAEKAARRKVILDAIARQEGLEVSEEELGQEFEKLAQASDKSAAALRAQFEKDQRIQSVRAYLLRNKALDFAYRNANISRG